MMSVFRSRAILFGAGLLALALSGAGLSQDVNKADPLGAAGPSLDELLRTSGLSAQEISDGVYKVLVSPGSEFDVVPVIATEGSLADGEFRVVYLWTRVVDVPDGFEHPGQMLRQIAEINDRIVIGKIGIDPDSGDVNYNSAFALRTADAQTLSEELEIAFYSCRDLRETLKPFTEEE